MIFPVHPLASRVHGKQDRAYKCDLLDTVQESLLSYAASALAGAIGDEEQARCGMAAFIRLLEADAAISKTLPRVCVGARVCICVFILARV